MKFDPKTEVTGAELAAVLGITGRRVQQLAQDGKIKTVKKGKYVLDETVKLYCATLSVRAEKMRDPVSEAIQQAELGTKKAKATKAVLETQELIGKMHRADDVALLVSEWFAAMRGMMLALPGRLAIDVSHITDPAEASERIRKEINLIMDEMMNYQYDPKKYEDLVRERLSWDKITIEDSLDGDG